MGDSVLALYQTIQVILQALMAVTAELHTRQLDVFLAKKLRPKNLPQHHLDVMLAAVVGQGNERP